MKTIVNSAQMKAVDDYTIEKVGIPAFVLMERAALSVVSQVKKHADKQDRILAVCGTGNNGADGIAAARILALEGYQVRILLVGEEDKASPLAKQQLSIARNLSLTIDNNIVIAEYTIIIDALFGIGLSRDITGVYRDVIEKINSGAYTVFSVDIPSGLSADTARPMGISVKADYTITFGLNKLGMLLYPGCEYAGSVTVADIGFPQIAVDAVNSHCFIYDDTDLVKLPKRKNYSNKGTYGKVLVIAGSKGMSGACYFSAKAAYRMGAGLVKVMTASENRIILQSQLPEALMYTYEEAPFSYPVINEIIDELNWADVIVIGPGIGISDNSKRLLEVVLSNVKVPLILDADGINLLTRQINMLEQLHMQNTHIQSEYKLTDMQKSIFDKICEEKASLHGKDSSPLFEFMQKGNNGKSDISSEFDRIALITACLPKYTVLTPHLKELSRLLNIPVPEIAEGLINTADRCVTNNNLIFAIKDARTIVAFQNERYINITGNNGMATGGSGDVLTGIIAALIAQGMDPKDAAKLGVFIHGLAGDKACEKKGEYALMASDIIDAL
jgi:NAD(P)H-hydrate epimerase